MLVPPEQPADWRFSSCCMLQHFYFIVFYLLPCVCVCVCAVCPSIEKVIYIAFEVFMARFTFPVCYEIIC